MKAKPHTVLIVDDEQSILDLTSSLLGKFGWQTETVTNAVEALERIELGHIDTVLIDIVLEGRGGVDLLMEIHEIHPKLPVVIMSGKVQTGAAPFMSMAAQFGARAILPKPFTVDELLNALETATGA